MKKTLILTVLFTAFQLIAIGQVVTRYFDKQEVLLKSPLGKMNVSKALVPLKEMPTFSVDSLLEEDKFYDETGEYPYRFSKIIDVSYTLQDGVWNDIDAGRLWRLDIYSPEACAIGLEFSSLYIPEGGELFMANRDQTVVYGPVNTESHNNCCELVTNDVKGDKVSIYLFEPASQTGKTRLNLSSVHHAYRGFNLGALARSSDLLPCHNDVMCYPEWELESTAVTKIIFPKNGYNYLCSGTLLMNERNDFKPYVLTAFHCIDIDENNVLTIDEKNKTSRWNFNFHYKKNVCGGGVSYGITYSGADFRAAWNQTDMTLLELQKEIFMKEGLSWLGWDRSGNTSARGIGIHHPAGSEMKISFSDQPVEKYNNKINWSGGGQSQPYTHWRVNYNNGTTQGGSSGSPLLNAEGRVIGQLHGGANRCPPADKYYGCLDLSWNGGNTSDTQLKHWLDPNNTNITKVNTATKDWIITKNSNTGGSGLFEVKNIPEIFEVKWTFDKPDFGEIIELNNRSVLVSPYKYGISAFLFAEIYEDGMLNDRLSIAVSPQQMRLEGEDYLSGLKTRYEVNFLPKDAQIKWRYSDGIKMHEQKEDYIIISGCNLENPWIEVSVIERDGNSVSQKKELRSYNKLSGVKLTCLQTWRGKNDEGHYVKKYAFRAEYTPADIPIDHLNFCWNNKVYVNGPDGNRPPLIPIMGDATMKTAGDIGICSIIAVANPDRPLRSEFSPENIVYPTDPPIEIEPLWSETMVDYVVVEMPSISPTETASGSIECLVSDYCGNKRYSAIYNGLHVEWNAVYHCTPNPASAILKVCKSSNDATGVKRYNTADYDLVTIRLYNDRELVRNVSGDFSAGDIQVDISGLPSGVYYLNILKGGQLLNSQVVIIKQE